MHCKTLLRKYKTTYKIEENIFKSISHMGLLSRNVKNSFNSTTKYDPNEKWGKNLNILFFKDVHMANEHMKRCLTALIIR